MTSNYPGMNEFFLGSLKKRDILGLKDRKKNIDTHKANDENRIIGKDTDILDTTKLDFNAEGELRSAWFWMRVVFAGYFILAILGLITLAAFYDKMEEDEKDLLSSWSIWIRTAMGITGIYILYQIVIFFMVNSNQINGFFYNYWRNY